MIGHPHPVDLSRSAGAFPFGMGRQLSATPQSWRYGQATLDALSDLRLERTRVWLKFPDGRSADPHARLRQVVRLPRHIPFPLATPAGQLAVGLRPTGHGRLGFEADLHIQAAALASLHYHYAGQSSVIPMDWTIDHAENDRKDLFVDTAGGTPRPYYNALRMLSMLPGTRYQASSDTLSTRGVGVYGLAAANSTTVAAMTWNYQWTQQNTYDSRGVFSNFPTAFRNSNVLVTRYRIDKDVHAGPLQPVEQFVIGPRTAGTYHSQTLPLDPNELRLIVLTPTTAPVGPRS